MPMSSTCFFLSLKASHHLYAAQNTKVSPFFVFLISNGFILPDSVHITPDSAVALAKQECEPSQITLYKNVDWAEVPLTVSRAYE